MEQIETQATDLRYLMQAAATQQTAVAAAPVDQQSQLQQQHLHPHPHPGNQPQSHNHNVPYSGSYPRLTLAEDERQHVSVSPGQMDQPLSASFATAAVTAVARQSPLRVLGIPMSPAGKSPDFERARSPQTASYSPAGTLYFANTIRNDSTNERAGSSMANNSNNNASPGGFANGNSETLTSKRKHDDDSLTAKQQRSKRNRDSDEFKTMSDKISSLEEQLQSLAQNVNTLRQEQHRIAPLEDRNLPVSSVNVSPSPSSLVSTLGKPEFAPFVQPHIFRGPTSMAFTVDVAKNTLHNMGYSGETQEDVASGQALGETPQSSPVVPPSSLQPVLGMSHSSQNHVPCDPLWEFDLNEIIRLCHVHEEEVGIMYPVCKISDVIAHAQHLMALVELSRKGSELPVDLNDLSLDIRTLTLKTVMCCALTVEEHGHSEKAIRLYDSIQPIVDKKLMSEPSSLTNLPLLALVAGYRFLANEEVLSWRVMGQVARHCLEQGLHRREGLDKITDEQQRRNAINTFWSAYVLDRRWSFGTGLPYVMHDDKIDPNLPLPINYPYLEAMITYSRLGAKIWNLVDFFEPAIIRDLKQEEFESVDRDILQWYESVPESIRISNLDRQLPSMPSYDIERLQIWTRLRLNQMRIWLYTPVLHSASSINKNMEQARMVVNLAKDTIRYLSRLNNGSDLYRRLQVFYHQFLTSAIAVLFLASTHQPVQFSAHCRKEFYLAMDLVKEMSAKSWVSQRLWRTIRSLKAYAPRLGLQQHNAEYHHKTDTNTPGPNSQRGSGAISAKSSAGLSGSRSNGNSVIHGASSSHNNVSNTNSNIGLVKLPAHQTLRNNNTVSPTLSPSNTGHMHLQTHHLATPALSAQVQQQQPQSSATPEDAANGAQIQVEMTRIFEGYMGLNGAARSPTPVLHRASDNGSDAGTPVMVNTVSPIGITANYFPQGEAIYEHFKTMF
ncbi:hypothetical protein SEPCBS119000_006496 [Sporothrix epigloea]|uniref:Xylanolytic transcriptional activator regulatory domain-containing protein n=1 Tax=Sporothrix epigloea TaxID=1892477 RepID=A0ABP0E3B8_9PEZI